MGQVQTGPRLQAHTNLVPLESGGACPPRQQSVMGVGRVPLRPMSLTGGEGRVGVKSPWPISHTKISHATSRCPVATSGSGAAAFTGGSTPWLALTGGAPVLSPSLPLPPICHLNREHGLTEIAPALSGGAHAPPMHRHCTQYPMWV